MMPSNFYQWCWFVFFTVGALGGWVALGMFCMWAVETVRVRNFLRSLGKP